MISLQSKGFLRVFSITIIQSISSLVLSLVYHPILPSIYDYWKNHSLTVWTFVNKIRSLLFNTLSWFVTTFLPKARFFFFMATIHVHSDTGAWENKIKSVTASNFPLHHYLSWSDGTGCHDLSFVLFCFVFNIEFQVSFSLSSFILFKRLFSFYSFFAITVLLSACVRLLIYFFSWKY